MEHSEEEDLTQILQDEDETITEDQLTSLRRRSSGNWTWETERNKTRIKDYRRYGSVDCNRIIRIRNQKIRKNNKASGKIWPLSKTKNTKEQDTSRSTKVIKTIRFFNSEINQVCTQWSLGEYSSKNGTPINQQKEQVEGDQSSFVGKVNQTKSALNEAWENTPLRIWNPHQTGEGAGRGRPEQLRWRS